MGHRRRVAGLRREEVAQLAGISVDYLVRLEQGRGPTPSAQVIASIARALQLSECERDHLFDLAGAARLRPGHIDVTPRPSTLRLLERVTDLPAILLDAKTDILAWNALAAALLGDFSAWPPQQRNVAWQRFLGRSGRVALDPAEAERAGAEIVTDLHAVAARYPDDPGLRRLLDELLSSSDEFARLWEEGRVAARTSSTKTVHHPELGLLTFDCDSLLVAGNDQRLIVYSAPPSSPETEALALLRVVGLQDLTSSR